MFYRKISLDLKVLAFQPLVIAEELAWLDGLILLDKNHKTQLLPGTGEKEKQTEAAQEFTLESRIEMQRVCEFLAFSLRRPPYSCITWFQKIAGM